MELSSESMESLALIPSGAERLTISLHFVGPVAFGYHANWADLQAQGGHGCHVVRAQACHAAQLDLPVKISRYNSWVLEC